MNKILTKEEIREIFLASGFTIKPGNDDLKDYVYAAAQALQDAIVAKLIQVPKYNVFKLVITQDAKNINCDIRFDDKVDTRVVEIITKEIKYVEFAYGEMIEHNFFKTDAIRRLWDVISKNSLLCSGIEWK